MKVEAHCSELQWWQTSSSFLAQQCPVEIRLVAVEEQLLEENLAGERSAAGGHSVVGKHPVEAQIVERER